MESVANIDFANDQVDKLGLPSVNIGDAKTVSMMQQKLSTEEPNAEVYDFKITQLPASMIVPAATVREIAVNLFTESCLSRLIPARREWTDEQHRAAIMGKNKKYDNFAKTHPRLLIALTGSDCDKKKLTHVMNMIEIREQQEKSDLSLNEQKSQIGEYFRRNFVRDALPGEEEERLRDGTGVRASVVQK